jgi:hypothetical protein
VIRSSLRVIALAALAAISPALASAQDDDGALNPAEPDFNLVALPTSLRLPVWKSAFRVTHRFQRRLGDGDFGDLASDLFGLDSGATIGLEFRMGIIPGGQVGFHRSSNGKTMEVFAQYSVLRQSTAGLDVSAYGSFEGQDNLQENHAPAIGAIISRSLGERAAFYLQPMFVNNTNSLPAELVDENNTFYMGIGGRVRVLETVYVVGELAPRASGYDPAAMHTAFAVEKRAGGHLFQLNFSNSFSTTSAQIARGGTGESDWYMGFNISRKFF